MELALGFFAFLAGFIDAVVGGGGLIQIPALLLFLPAEMTAVVSAVLGTNKFSSICGTSMAVVQYSRKVQINWKAIAPAAASAMLFSYIGARTVSRLDPAIIKPLILTILVVVAIYTYWKKDFGALHRPRLSGRKERLVGIAVGATIGFYDGFFGPGTGSFLIFAFIGLFGYDFLVASANAKVINLGTNLAAVTYFASTGNVYWKIALIMGTCNIVGNLLGARMALLKGNKFVRVFFLVIVGALILRLGWQMFNE
ncbi:MAG: sulfite exporter TauE/SafE family protein [Verrucomicrobiales bacterium]